MLFEAAVVVLLWTCLGTRSSSKEDSVIIAIRKRAMNAPVGLISTGYFSKLFGRPVTDDH